MANTNLTLAQITNETLMTLENSLGFTMKVNRRYDAQFAKSGAKIGDVLNVRKPVRYTVSTGQALDLQDSKQTSVPVKLDTQNHVDFQFSSQELALDIDRFRERYIGPAVAALANQIDYNGLAQYKNVWNHVGTPGTVPTSLETYLLAKEKLDSNAVPRDGQRYVVMSPMMEVKLTNALLATFNPQGAISDQYKTGEMGRAAGFSFVMDQNLSTHTVGTVASGVGLTNGTTLDGATSIVTDGWNSAATTLKQGDVISLAGVYAVNPQSRQSTGSLAQFVVTQDMSDTTGSITIPISPAIHLTGAEQNCYYASSTTAIADGVAVYVMDVATAYATVTGKTSPQGLAFHRDAFTLACADLPLPGGTDMAARASDDQLGLSIRIVRQYDITTDLWPCRLDILYGWATLRPELACRISA